MITIVDAETPEQIASVRALVAEYRAWLRAEVDHEMPESEVPTVAALDEELETLPGEYAPPFGCLLLALVDGQAAGCVALRPYAPGAGEVKRLWVRPTARGHGVGRLLAETLVVRAQDAGYTQLLLSTSVKMTDAQALYRSLGFEVIAPYFDGPDAFMAQEMFMQLAL